jgi:hypothetical protein
MSLRASTSSSPPTAPCCTPRFSAPSKCARTCVRACVEKRHRWRVLLLVAAAAVLVVVVAMAMAMATVSEAQLPSSARPFFILRVVVSAHRARAFAACSYLSGMPELKLGLNDKVMFQTSGRKASSKV